MSLIRKCDRCNKTIDSKKWPSYHMLRIESSSTQGEYVDIELCLSCQDEWYEFMVMRPTGIIVGPSDDESDERVKQYLQEIILDR